ncbi:DUF735 family protein [Borreliella garinii]|uniref:DUF735 family protein n=1 Tax=Borreliella garinii TaxID=29519 RepID=UPI001F1B1A3F|nr:DUF735 family protein [Borreliella garinii]
MNKEIPKFLENTQIEKFIYNELDYKKEILRELKELLKNFLRSSEQSTLKTVLTLNILYY